MPPTWITIFADVSSIVAQLQELLAQSTAAVKVEEHGVAQAQSNLHLAQSNLERYRSLYCL